MVVGSPLLTSRPQAPTPPFLPPSGASVISTRCSETYETKTALLSLFGIPLWYHSQSPRVILQVGTRQGSVKGPECSHLCSWVTVPPGVRRSCTQGGVFITSLALT